MMVTAVYIYYYNSIMFVLCGESGRKQYPLPNLISHLPSYVAEDVRLYSQETWMVVTQTRECSWLSSTCRLMVSLRV